MLYLAPPLQGGVDSATEFLTGRLVFGNGLAYRLQIVILVMFAAILAISWIERRMWCRHLCPLGALLGLVGRGGRLRPGHRGAQLHHLRCLRGRLSHGRRA